MMENVVVGFSSDNGGPLDHANNAPFRGGKHTLWEGGVRTEAFLWSPLLPAARRGTKWDGIMHISDWWATYLGAAGATPPADTGPRAPDAKNLWPAILSGGQSPRTEVVHMVH